MIRFADVLEVADRPFTVVQFFRPTRVRLIFESELGELIITMKFLLQMHLNHVASVNTAGAGAVFPSPSLNSTVVTH